MGNNICLGKKAIIEICLVPETLKITDKQLEKEIRKSLNCDWLAEIEKVTVRTKQ